MSILFENKIILICFGTRPEYIKVKSLIDNLPYILYPYNL